MGYVTNSPYEEQLRVPPDSQFDQFPPVYILPSWVFSAISAHYNLVDLHDYGILRQVLALEDVAQHEALTAWFSNWLHETPTVGLGEWYDPQGDVASLIRRKTWGNPVVDRPKTTEAQEAEIRNTVLPMAAMRPVQQDILNRLRGEPDNGSVCADILAEATQTGVVSHTGVDPNSHHGKPLDESDLREVRIVSHMGSVYIVVEEGFVALLEDPIKHLAFLRQVLKSVYAIAPIRVVNRSAWYRKYVKALKA